MANTSTIRSHPFDDDKLREECGVFGVFGHKDSAALTALGLHALQHRGQEAAGIVTYDGKQFHGHRAPGHVGDIFSSEAVMKRLPGHLAVGHNRYSTTGETAQRNIQPLFAEFESGGFALAHNGNLTNAQILHRDLVKRGCLFQSTTDTEVIIHLIAISDQGSVVDRLIDTLKRVVGAYSLVAMTNDQMIGVRDPMGVRPLVLGSLDGAHVLASESCALDIIGADFVRDVEPGEMVVIDKEGLKSLKPFGWTPSRLCVFEYIYFARPDSIVDGSGVYEARKRIGAELARESHASADVVIPVPDSGVPSAMGYASETGLPYELGIIRNHYVGRTFIEPADHIRHLGVKLKHNASRAVIEGKRVILVDDSIVRGTTSVKIVEMMRNAGAKEVHMRISSPPTTHSCFYGVDTPERDQLLAAQHSVDEMRKFMGADSLAFVSIEGLYRAMGLEGRDEQTPQYCDACFTGDYPVSLIDREGGETIPQLSFLTNLG
ncbi:MAG: amidophosphoribosyltransferase [Alphaproteobacteria bacterium]|nr:amidophosphoribosyltransferase [Alphaproteobacteria bacterium]